jgi:hypothetical protein
MGRMVVLIAICALLIGNAVAQALANDSSDLILDSGGLSSGAQRQHDQIYRDQAKKRLDSLKADTDRLAQLSQELKHYVDNTNPDVTLSVDAIKKADEIRKLAKQVSDKMKGQ